jgi:hypothetical protein
MSVVHILGGAERNSVELLAVVRAGEEHFDANNRLSGSTFAKAVGTLLNGDSVKGNKTDLRVFEFRYFNEDASPRCREVWSLDPSTENLGVVLIDASKALYMHHLIVDEYQTLAV